MSQPLPCIVCGTQLESADPREDEGSSITNQPYKGTAFTSHGHYGSTFFDEMNGSFIEVTICDECLQTAAASGRILLGIPHRPRYEAPTYTPYPA